LPPELSVVGSINLDLVAHVEQLPRRGETLTATAFDRIPGGKGANQAVAARRLGADVTMVGAVGDDELAEPALAGLGEAGVLFQIEGRGETGIALILVDAQGENQIVVVPGANANVRADGIDGAVLCQLEIPLETVEHAAALADRFFLNAAPANAVSQQLVGRAEVVVVNRYELDALPETPHLTALTLGAEGAALLEDGREVARAAPPRVDVVDGTAAGDAFTACFVVSLLEERPHDEALRRACAAGALAASRFGAQTSLPTAAEVNAILG
jgi:ribokinase